MFSKLHVQIFLLFHSPGLLLYENTIFAVPLCFIRYVLQEIKITGQILNDQNIAIYY